MAICLVSAVLLLAFANGANDNFKGVATLFGGGACGYGKALGYATAATLAGSLTALFLGGALARSFSGKGLVPDALTNDRFFLAAVAGSAALTVILANRVGMPVSTTHALIGGLMGAGLVAAGHDIRWAVVLETFVTPLLLSPFIAILLAILVDPLLRGARHWLGVRRESRLGTGGTVAPALDGLHFASAGAVSLARGLNDTPKIVALLIAAAPLQASAAWYLLVAAIMAIGGVLGARRVAETMSLRITRMNDGQAFAANLATALLVTGASGLGMPVSTTHVSVGALCGTGIANGQARWPALLQIAMAWVTTLPVAAGTAAALYVVLTYFA